MSGGLIYPGKWQIPHQLAHCHELQNEVLQLRASLEELKTERLAVAGRYMQRALARREDLKKALVEAQEAKDAADTNLLFAKISLAMSLTFLAVGVAFTAPIAVFSATAVAAVAGVGMLGWQLYEKQATDQASCVAGFGVDRTFMFAEFLGSNASSAAGKIAAHSIQATSLLLGSWQLIEANEDQESARSKLSLALTKLGDVDHRLNILGKNTAAWANALETTTEATIAAIERYVVDNKATDCVILPVGPAR
jgi:hypothetical protein